MRRYYMITGSLLFIAVTALLLPLPSRTGTILLLSGLLLWLATVVYGASRICSQLFVPALCKGDPLRKQVALTFDDGPQPERTGAILEILERHRCRASFFLAGRQIEGNEEILQEMAEKGHTLGNHSFSHSIFFPLFSGTRISREIQETNRLIEGATGKKVQYFRPPFGVTNPNIYRGLRGSGLLVAGWSIRSFDTRNEPWEKVVDRISRKLDGGAIILLHETSEQIQQILEQLIPLIHTRGLECVTLDRLLKVPGE